MEIPTDLRTEADRQHVYECDTPRLSVLTKMILDRHQIPYTSLVNANTEKFSEQYHTYMPVDERWREKEVVALELELKKDGKARVRFEHQVAVKQTYFETKLDHSGYDSTGAKR